MKNFLIILSILISLSTFAASNDTAATPSKSLTCILDDDEHVFELDYFLPSEKKHIKLSAALSFEDYLHQQIRHENQKYDELAIKKLYGDRDVVATSGIKRKLRRQYRKTMELLADAETLSAYISWLRS